MRYAFPSEETAPVHDGPIVLRETPCWKVREHWAWICDRLTQINRRRHLAYVHHIEHFDETLPPTPPKKLTHVNRIGTKLSTAFDRFKLWVCINLHSDVSYVRGDSHYTCNCGRMFMLPWGKYEDLPKGTYYSEPTVPAGQIDCKGARARFVVTCE